jgi:four helix bundle protein
MSDIRSFEDLNCWKKGREIRIKVSELVKTFPSEERFELVSQMRRASRSVSHNIAEGYGRFHFQENIQFCRVSRGSLYELIDQIDCALCEKYISDKTASSLADEMRVGIKIINGYINYLKKAKDQ